MNRLSVIFLIALFIGHTYAQNIEIKKFELLENDQTAVTNPKLDNNGTPCALIRVNSLGDNTEFENTYVVDVVKYENEYGVYMAEGAKSLRIKQPGYLTTTVSFKDYGLNSLKSSCCYRMIIHGDKIVDNNIGSECQTINSIYKQGWGYKGEALPTVLKLIIKREALGGKKEAQIAMANICLFEKKNDSAVEWVRRIIEDGDTLCLEQMDGELLFQYAIRIPNPESYEKYHSQISIEFLGYVVGQLSLKDEYLNASRYCYQAYKKGVSKALDEHNKYNQLAESISIDKLYELIANKRSVNVDGEYFNEFDLNMSYEKGSSPILYSIIRELANRGCLRAKEVLINCNKELLIN